MVVAAVTLFYIVSITAIFPKQQLHKNFVILLADFHKLTDNIRCKLDQLLQRYKQAFSVYPYIKISFNNFILRHCPLRENTLKSSEYRCLENHGGHAAIPSDAVKKFQHTMVSVDGVLVKGSQDQAARLNDFRVGKSKT